MNAGVKVGSEKEDKKGGEVRSGKWGGIEDGGASVVEKGWGREIRERGEGEMGGG